MAKPPPGQPIFQLRIDLNDAHVPIWRRVLVPGSVRVAKLHDMLQAAMGWTNSHLHSFEVDGTTYGMQFDDYPEDELDEKEFTVLRALGDATKFSYEYDFGDGWEHTITVESMSRPQMGIKFGVCLDGAGACPPEDCGGVWGYKNLVDVLADPTHEEHEELSGWIGGPIDPMAFDLAIVNARLQAVR
jgi:hypothetical protein